MSFWGFPKSMMTDRNRFCKIICTIGPASSSPDMLRQLIAAGMDVARLNFSHGDHASHAKTIAIIRELALQAGRPVAILGDLQGPKLRVGELPAAGFTLQPGQEVRFTCGAPQEGSIPCQYADLPQLVEPGDRMLLDDGMMEVEVLETRADGISARVISGGVLHAHKGINLPRTNITISSITEKDVADLHFALAQGVDWLALSFVRSAADMAVLRERVAAAQSSGPGPQLIAKIEKPEAVQNIEEIIAASDGIMVARGDLGIEIPAEDVPMIQKDIIRLCNQAGKPVITATQMLDSMMRNPRPTRAEASDVANAVLDGTDAVMLSGETAAGKYPLPALTTLDRIVRRAEKAPHAEVTPHNRERVGDATQAIAHAASDLATYLQARAIVAPTASGYTARLVSRYRPRVPIIAVTPDPAIQRQLNLLWGVIPLRAPRRQTTDVVISDSVEMARQAGLVQAGDLVIVTAGTAASGPGTTDLIKIHRIEESDTRP